MIDIRQSQMVLSFSRLSGMEMLSVIGLCLLYNGLWAAVGINDLLLLLGQGNQAAVLAISTVVVVVCNSHRAPCRSYERAHHKIFITNSPKYTCCFEISKSITWIWLSYIKLSFYQDSFTISKCYLFNHKRIKWVNSWVSIFIWNHDLKFLSKCLWSWSSEV